MKRRKPKCYESYRRNICLGRMTSRGSPAARCLKCRWFEENAKNGENCPYWRE